MFSPLYINYPSWIHPEVFPNVPVLGIIRWYGLMYVFAFATAFIVLKQELKEGALDSPGHKTTEDDIFSFIATGIVFLLVGARIFSTLVYDSSKLYWKKPWLIFWPFDTVTHEFTGLAGMSYHGGFIGGLIGMIVWCKMHKVPVMKWIDAMCVAIPAGYFFGRLGNFLNGELYGRITTMPWGMVFPRAKAYESFSTSLEWVQAFVAKCGLPAAVVPQETQIVRWLFGCTLHHRLRGRQILHRILPPAGQRFGLQNLRERQQSDIRKYFTPEHLHRSDSLRPDDFRRSRPHAGSISEQQKNTTINTATGGGSVGFAVLLPH